VYRENGSFGRLIAAWWLRNTAPVTDAEALIASRDRQTLFRSPRFVRIFGYYVLGGACVGLLLLFGAPIGAAGLVGLLTGFAGQLAADYAWVKLRRARPDE